MLMEESQLQDSNPDTLQAASPQAQLPSRPRFSGLKPELNLSLVKPLMPISLELLAPMPPLKKNLVSPANRSADLANVVNAVIHHALITPLLGYFEDKYLSFAFALQNEAGSKLGNTIVQFPDSAQLTC
ncbi:hypothetical protein DSO57_1016719 [Entomophthora muscae]|uniref:Uncharacterized protein n=1 Tax=Entomophthora muscae TaxID=34485 RepID=A0ACC2RW32_9FUNG|nr:hypothetical protein DSO57_1016719 [Entomophthora muscae]